MFVKISIFLLLAAISSSCFGALLPRNDIVIEDDLEKFDDLEVLFTDGFFGQSRSKDIIQDIYDECGKSRVCYGESDSCVESKNCESLLSYGEATPDGKLPMDLYGKSHKSKYAQKFWIGFGINLSGSMEYTAVVQCGRYPNGSGEVVAGCTKSHHNYETLKNRQTGISSIVIQAVDEFQHCSFSLDVQRTIDATVYDLRKPYYLLVGSGKIKKDDDFYAYNDDDDYQFGEHFDEPRVSKTTVVMACGNHCAGKMNNLRIP